MFNIHKPCKDCPFIRGGTMNLSLRPGRMEQIVASLHSDQIFRCHKTIDYNRQDYETGDVPFHEGNQFCAGALIYMDKCDKPNMPMQVATRMGWLDPSKLEGHDQVIDPLPISKFDVHFPRKPK